jgi:hypothetical protein
METSPPTVVVIGDEPKAPSPLQPQVVKGKITDSTGRQLVVRPLNSLETYRLLRLTKATGEEGFFGLASMAAAVRSIGDAEVAFPGSERELEFRVQQLGNEGLAAAAKALAGLRDDGDLEAPKS